VTGSKWKENGKIKGKRKRTGINGKGSQEAGNENARTGGQTILALIPLCLTVLANSATFMRQVNIHYVMKIIRRKPQTESNISKWVPGTDRRRRLRINQVRCDAAHPCRPLSRGVIEGYNLAYKMAGWPAQLATSAFNQLGQQSCSQGLPPTVTA